MGDTKISWTDKTWPITVGCQRVSAGCGDSTGGGCYAERTVHRVNVCQAALGNAAPYADLVKLVKRDNRDVPRWTGNARFFADRLAQPLSWRKPARIFVSSQSDLFHADITNEQIAAVFGVMASAPRHTFQVLTKRPERMVEWFQWIEAKARHNRETQAAALLRTMNTSIATGALSMSERTFGLPVRAAIACAAWPLPNVWVGVSVENQSAADERVPLLVQSPAVMRFLSCEPLLGPVTLAEAFVGEPRPAIGWVIAGCESGPGARRCDVAWLRSLRDQCAEAGVPFFLKQAVQSPITYGLGGVRLRNFEEVTEGNGSHRKGGGVIELPYLDGKQWCLMPEVTP